ncbi:enoyl-CoA hydratase/isomerase family protein [uncultured Sphingomonas sp.]|uniref:enoyl-CoA hydratase/isomerase family protein n=1 Tax=uncultured Sphingomonas sp. TaxID=158754 RepID=UPI0035CC802E
MTTGTDLPDVVCGEADGVATIVIDRPSRRNALAIATWHALRAAVVAADADPRTRVILVRGAAGTFGAGNDLDEFAGLCGDPEGALAFGFAMATAMQAIETASKPVIMAIQGSCYGASVALALAGDLRFAADDASFAITPAKLGALYLRSDLHRLVAAVGAGHAKRLIYSAQAIDAARAERIGLIDEVLAADRFEEELGVFLQHVLRGSTYTVRRSKEMLSTVGAGLAPPEDEESLASFVAATQGEDFREGVDAFLGKRAPRFARAG